MSLKGHIKKIDWPNRRPDWVSGDYVAYISSNGREMSVTDFGVQRDKARRALQKALRIAIAGGVITEADTRGMQRGG